jgi:hypothetical protein
MTTTVASSSSGSRQRSVAASRMARTVDAAVVLSARSTASSDAAHPESPPSFDAALNDPVGDQHEPLAGVELAFGALVAPFGPSGPEGWMGRPFELLEVAVAVDEVGRRVTAVDPRGLGNTDFYVSVVAARWRAATATLTWEGAGPVLVNTGGAGPRPAPPVPFRSIKEISAMARTKVLRSSLGTRRGRTQRAHRFHRRGKPQPKGASAARRALSWRSSEPAGRGYRGAPPSERRCVACPGKRPPRSLRPAAVSATTRPRAGAP